MQGLQDAKAEAGNRDAAAEQLRQRLAQARAREEEQLAQAEARTAEATTAVSAQRAGAVPATDAVISALQDFRSSL